MMMVLGFFRQNEGAMREGGAGDQLEVASLIFLLLKKCVVIVPFTRFYVENLEVS